MRKLALILICAVGLAHAQVVPTQLFIPSPLGIVITIGKWIYDANTQQEIYYIEVAGQGATAEESKNNGFRLAIEQALGSIISSETEVQQGRIVRDEIISYASGYVDRFEIVKQQPNNTGIQTTMQVWVRRSALNNRLLNRSEKSGEIDNSRASVQLATITQERTTGDRLLQTVLDDFPKRAFDITLGNTKIKYINRQSVVEIPFRLGWNKNYLSSFWSALDATRIKTSSPIAQIAVSPGGWFKGYGGTANYDDPVKYIKVVEALIGSRPSILITLRGNSNSVLSRQCFNLAELDHLDGYVVTQQHFVYLSPYGNLIKINGGFEYDGIVQIPISAGTLASASQVDADIVPGLMCPKQ